MLGRILSTAALAGVVASIFYVFGDSQTAPRVRSVLMEPVEAAATANGATEEGLDLVSARDPSPAL